MSDVTMGTTNQSSVLDSHNQTSTLVTMVNPFQGAKLVNGVLQVPQYQQILMQIPTTEILKMQAHQQQQSESVTSTDGSSSSQSIGVPQYQPILIQIPTIDILKMQAQTPNHQQCQPKLQSQTITSTAVRSDGITSSFMNDSRLVTRATMYQSKLFQHLKTDLPVTVVSHFEVSIPFHVLIDFFVCVCAGIRRRTTRIHTTSA